MKVTNVEKKEKSIVELTVEVPADEFETAIQKAYLKSRGQISVPGFRKGKAPRKIIEGMYGSNVFYEEAINALYPDAYAAAVEDAQLDDVGYPQLELVQAGKDGFTFKAQVSVRPEVKLGDYKGLTAPMDIADVSEEDMENELKPLVARATRLVSVEQEIKQGDTAVIDFEGFDNGVAFDGGKGENYSLEIGSNSFVPGFEEQLVGLKAGDEKQLNITFPQDYVPDLAGKDVVFQVKVLEVKEKQGPVVDDEFAKDVSEFETLETLKKDLGEKLRQRREKEAREGYEEAILTQLVDNMQCEIPEGMVEVQLDKIMDDYANRLKAQGISLEDYTQMMGMNATTLRASARPAALKQVQVELALGAVAQAEKLELCDEELEQEIARLAEEYKLEAEQVKAAIPQDSLRKDLLFKKASALVNDAAKIGPAPEPAPEKEEKPTRVRKKKADSGEPAAQDSTEVKPKRTRKKKTEEVAAD